MFPPQFSLCPEEYSHLIPQGAQTLIELSEEGIGPNSGDTEYFYLGHTADRGIAISVATELYRTKESHCDLPLEEIKAIKERIDRLSYYGGVRWRRLRRFVRDPTPSLSSPPLPRAALELLSSRFLVGNLQTDPARQETDSDILG